MIVVDSLVKSYGKKRVLAGIDLEVGEGRIYGLLGPNGAGKTTLLKLLSCLLRPDSGDAFVGGLSIRREARSVRSSIGLVPQEAAMYAKLSVGENLALMGRLHGMEAADCRERADRLLERLRLKDAAGTRAEHCSAGMRQALNIAMGLVHRPRVVLLDEPTEGLDPAVRRAAWELFQEMAGEGRTLLLTTHVMSEAEGYCDEVALLRSGEIRVVGPPREVRERLVGEASLEEVFMDLPAEKGRA